jgi:alpha-tubulin suppressor-like RCC1 family protein
MKMLLCSLRRMAWKQSAISGLLLLAAAAPAQLNESWILSVNGQVVEANPDGSFLVPNISALDWSGDFVSEAWFRVVGVGQIEGVQRYVSSEFFTLRQGAIMRVTNLQFLADPPRPEAIYFAPDTFIVTNLSAPIATRLIARYADLRTNDVTGLLQGVSYRSSNGSVVGVDTNGVLHPAGRGRAVVTASYDGGAAVACVVVTTGAIRTQIAGFVLWPDGRPVAGALVTLEINGWTTTTDATGRFAFYPMWLSEDNVAFTVNARFHGGGQRFFGAARSVPMEPFGVTDAGFIRLAPVTLALGAVAAGEAHSLALRSDGSLWAWGDNRHGQLGDGTTNSRPVPARVGADSDWVEVAAGSFHSLARKSGGTLWAWGWNEHGQLGNGTTNNALQPTLVSGTNRWRGMSGGRFHTLGLNAANRVWSWGRNNDLQLGGPGLPPAMRTVPGDTGMGGTKIAAGGSHGLVFAAGQLSSWGRGWEGQLGNRFRGVFATPDLVDGYGYVWSQSFAGGSNFSLAIREDARLMGWGGQLSGSDRPGFLNARDGWFWVDAEGGHALALNLDGSVWDNLFGPVGSGTIVEWAVLSAGGAHTLGLSVSGELWAWGRNVEGQLGDGSRVDRPVPVKLGGTGWGAHTPQPPQVGPIRAVRRLPDGRLTFEFQAAAWQLFTVERSTDLVSWTARGSVEGNGQWLSFTNPTVSTLRQEFFRVRWNP